MRSPIPIAAGLALLLTAVHAMAQERILISSEWGNVSADLADNAATRSLVEMLPLTIEMRDHLRQEKTGNLPSPLPEVARQRDFSAGTSLDCGVPMTSSFIMSAGKFQRPESSYSAK